MNNKVIVLGSDHYNAIGVVQSLGREGLYVILVINSKNSDTLIAKSKYVRELYQVANFSEGINLIISKLKDNLRTVIIPCGDEAALLLEKNKDRLKKDFDFQHTVKNFTIAQLMNKKQQASIAALCGLDAPNSFELDGGTQQLPIGIIYPCIVKPLLSCEGDKNDISIVYTEHELNSVLRKSEINTRRVLVQQYIEHQSIELNILGCSYSDGKCDIPLCVEKIRVHPEGRGSVSVGEIRPLYDAEREIKDSIVTMVKKMGYVGLFSVELLKEKSSGKYFFIEMNLRNDALNVFILKAGVNLPYLHYQDLSNDKLKTYLPTNKHLKMICDPIHLSSLYHRSINPIIWLKDIITSDGFMLYDKSDKKIFLYNLLNIVKHLCKLV